MSEISDQRRGLRFGVGGLPTEAPPSAEINGHPSVVLPNKSGEPVVLTVCCSCGHLRTILWLSGDRYYCSQCRAEGDSRPTVIPIS